MVCSMTTYTDAVTLSSLQDLCFLTNGDPPAWLPNTLELELSLGLELLETVLREYPQIFMKVREGGREGERKLTCGEGREEGEREVKSEETFLFLTSFWLCIVRIFYYLQFICPH